MYQPQGSFGMPNILRGIVPTISSWDVSPTNLANSTDGNFSTATGIGSSTRAGAFDTIGQIIFDLGSIQTAIFGFKYGMSASIGAARAFSLVSDDNVTYTRNDAHIAEINSNTQQIGYSTIMIGNGRYFQIYVNNDTAGATVSFRLFEAYAYKILNP